MLEIREELVLLRRRLQGVERKLKRLAARSDGIEDGLEAVTGRLDQLGQDVRQRFRVVNERLATLAA